MRDELRQPIIIAKDVNKWYGQFHALKDINMEVQKGEVVVIFGPSGSGKSTFIRTINRLEEHQKGQIIVDGIELTNDMRNIEMIRMETGMVFQQFNLFPHLTVLDNIMLAPMQVRKWPKEKAEEAALQLLKRGRDVRHRRRNTRKPPSIVLAALALEVEPNGAGLLDEIVSIAGHIVDRLEQAGRAGRLIDVRNPAYNPDQFTDR